MKTYSFTKKELDYLTPVDSTMNALNVAIQVFVVNQVYKRLGISPLTKARYDLAKGEMYVEEEPKPESNTEAKPAKPEEKPTVEPTEPPKV